MTDPLRICALLSGGGRTLINIADHIDRGDLNATITGVIASRPNAVGIERARARGMSVEVIPPIDQDSTINAVRASEPDLICLCGYMSLLRIEPDFRGRVINIHPALLPRFGGQGMFGNHVHNAVIESRVAFSGCTVHFVDDEYDHGPTILQRACPVLPDDDIDALAARVFEQECIAYPQAIAMIHAGEIELSDGRVVRRHQA